jgi:hypothetical protein
LESAPVGPCIPVGPAGEVVIYGSKFQGVTPSPIFSLFVPVSNPGSPDFKIGFVELQLEAVARLNWNFTLAGWHAIY